MLEIPYILRLLVAVALGVLVLKVGVKLLLFLVRISVRDNPPEESRPKYEDYMQLSLLRKVFMAWFYLGLILEIIFIPLVANHVSEASVGHLLLFGAMAVVGMTVNLIGLFKQKQKKRCSKK